MAALSYKGRFCKYVKNGLQPKPKGRVKRQTMRNERKHEIKVGETLYHYYGMRTKQCTKLGESKCKSNQIVQVVDEGIVIFDKLENGRLKFNKAINNTTALNRFAYADGFTNWREMKLWWKTTHGTDCFPWTGRLIKW